MGFKLYLSLLFLLQWKYSASTDTNHSKSVNLSNRGLRREDFFMKLQHQIAIYEVTELILRGNKFDQFIDCSTKLDRLRILDLSQNRLKKFFFLCTNEYNLESLNVSHNEIEYIDDRALNQRVIKLKILDVSYNDLFVVNDTMLQHMKNLEFLSLASNPIRDNIDEHVFQNITLLKHLDLRNISTTFFPPMMFEPLNNLEYIDISENPIDDIPILPTSIKYLYVSHTNILHLSSFIMPQLVVLALDHSYNLSSVLLNNFENLTQLETLLINDSPRLSQVRLKGVNTHHLLPKLNKFSLQNCNIETLHEEILWIIQKTAVLDLQNNPWRCDCQMTWVHDMNLTVDLLNSFRCQMPLKFNGKLLHEVPRDKLECEDPVVFSSFNIVGAGRIIYPVLSITMIMVLIGVAAVGIIYYSRDCLSQWVMKMRHRRTDTVSYTNVIESTNDLVRILPSGETNDHVDT